MSQTDDHGIHRVQSDPHRKGAPASEAHGILNPVAIPWPSTRAPRPMKPNPVPAPSAPLPQADVLVVTWTSGEARTMGQLFAGQELEDWIEYKHNVAAFVPKVTGSKAPFNDSGPYNKRYYQTLGLYCMVSIGNVSVVCVKSGLHPAYDGPAVPMKDLWQQMISEVQPKLVVTTGTGGGIGSDVKLGDVIIANHVRFSCTGQFKDEPWANAAFPCSKINEPKMRSLVTPALLQPNSQKLKSGRLPMMVYPSVPNSIVVTTDTFAFDDSTDHYHLQGLGTCCDMGDAVLGLAMTDSSWTSSRAMPAWVAIRNASDPQIPNSSGDIKTASEEAEKIYSAYQEVTTAGSLVATWAAIVAELGG